MSAKTKDGIDELRGDLLYLLPEGQPFFERESATDQTSEERITELIREKALQLTRDEVPHSISVEIDELDEKLLRAFVLVETESQKQILVGKKGAMIREIGTRARPEIEALLGHKVFLELVVKVRPKWRRDDATLERLGLYMRAVDPEGVEWEVTRSWLEVPRWRVGRPELTDMPGADAGTDFDLAGVVLWIVISLAVFALLLVGLPVLIFLAAFLVAIGGLVIRIVFRRPWLVKAKSGTRELRWRVRGTLGSRRAIHEVAAAIARGDGGFTPRGAIRPRR